MRFTPTSVFLCLCLTIVVVGEVAATSCEKITMMIGAPAGSNTDLLGRQVLQKISEKTGETFVVVNRAGAVGLMANEAVARAKPDGCTLLMASFSSMTIMPHMRLRMPYDPQNDLVPVLQLAKFDYVLVSHPSVPVRSVQDLVRIGKKAPGVLNFGSTGVGSGFHLAAELFAIMADIRILHVPYGGGSAPVLKDILGGHIDVMFASGLVVEPYVKAGRLRMLGTTGRTRNSMYSGIPTIDEAGVRGYEMSGWIGIFAPKGTPPSMAESINRTFQDTLNTQAMRTLWKNQDVEYTTNSPAEFAKIVRDAYRSNGELIRKTGIKPE